MVTGPAAEGSFAELRRQIRMLAERQIAPHVAQAEAERELLEPIREALGRAGCFGRTLPAAYGGRDGGLGAFAAQQE
jgi:alkylation response protein AidB-like acyl-CoA dehydrogenase